MKIPWKKTTYQRKKWPAMAIKPTNTSLFLFGPNNQFRLTILRITSSSLFDSAITLTIILSSIILGMTDYTHIDRNRASPSYGSPISSGSWRNLFVNHADIVFTVIFTVEMVLKIIGMGFFWGKGNTYLRDGWNCLDFVITTGSLVALLPAVPRVTMFRIFRLLRPLKSISKLPGLRKLIHTMIKAIPQLINVIVYFLLGLFMIFDLLGISLFMGSMSTVCRLTPFPVKAEWAPALNYTQFRCLNAPNMDILPQGKKWTKDSSPWRHAQDCYWPTDDNDKRLCSLSKTQGNHHCENTWCGSNYDIFGNPKFKGDTVLGMYQHFFTRNQLLSWATYKPELNFGYTVFDNALLSIVPIFQALTVTDWETILFMIGDSSGLVAPVLYFSVVIVLGSFIVLNLIVAVLVQQFENLGDGGDSSEEKTALSTSLRHLSSRFFQLAPHKTENVRKNVFLNSIVDSRLFNSVVTVVILINAVIFASDHYPSTTLFDSICEKINFFCSVFFFLDMALRMLALGVSTYFLNFFNCFDSVLVFLTVIEVCLSPPAFLLRSGVAHHQRFAALRTLRLLRLFKLAKQWKTMHTMFGKLLRTAVDMANFLALLFLFVYTASLVGMEFFASRYRFDEFGFKIDFDDPQWGNTSPPREHFDNLLFALITVFCILTLERWNVVMYDAWRATQQGASTLFFIMVILFGQFILLNLFLAIVLTHFIDGDEELAPNSTTALQQVGASDQANDECNTVLNLDPTDGQSSGEEKEAPAETVKVYFAFNTENTLMLFGPKHRLRLVCFELITHPYFDNFILTVIMCSSVMLVVDSPLLDPTSNLKKGLQILDYFFCAIFAFESVCKMIVFGLYFLPGAYLRSTWNMLDFVVVAISIISLGAQDKGGKLKGFRALRALRAFRPLRLIKQLPSMKVVVDTLIASIPHVMNVVTVSIFFLLVYGIIGVSVLKGRLRSCQLGSEDTPGILYNPLSLKPNAYGELLISPRRWQDLSPSERSWFGPKSPFNLTVEKGECALLWPEFPCCLEWPKNSSSVPTSRQICECWGSTWDVWSGYQTFDNIGQALLTLFSTSSLAGWVDLMFTSGDQKDIDMQPVRNANLLPMVLFYISFVIVIHYVLMNLVIGVIVECYKTQAIGTEFVLLTENQQAFAKTMKIMERVRLQKQSLQAPGNPIGDFCFWVVSKPYFDSIMMCCVVVSVFMMMLQHSSQSEQFSYALWVLECFFCAIFTVEAVLKSLAFFPNYFQEGWSRYFQEGWSRFDFSIVLLTDVSLILEVVIGLHIGPLVTLARTVRVGRIFRLLKYAEGLNRLFTTLVSTFLGLANICSLWCLLLFIFAVLANQSYSKIGLHDKYDDNMNFQTFANSILTLLVFSMGGDWVGFMMSASFHNPGCVNDPPYDPEMCGFSDRSDCIPLNGCGQSTVPLFMSVFQFLVGTVMLNLFIGVIVEEFRSQNQKKLGITESDFNVFSEHWTKYDELASYFMDLVDLEPFLLSIPPPWNKLANYTKEALWAHIASWKLKLYKSDKVHFYDLINALTADLLQQELNVLFQKDVQFRKTFEDHLTKIQKQHSKLKYTLSFDKSILKDHKIIDHTNPFHHNNKNHQQAASVIQKQFRSYRQRLKAKT